MIRRAHRFLPLSLRAIVMAIATLSTPHAYGHSAIDGTFRTEAPAYPGGSGPILRVPTSALDHEPGGAAATGRSQPVPPTN